MGIIIHDADLIHDRDILIDRLNQNRVRKTDERRYRWLYLENPFGKAKAWLAVDDQNGEVVGFTSVSPRLMHICGEDMVCWNCGDFSINKRYRSLGVASELRLAGTRCVNHGEVPFLYAHPNDGSVPICVEKRISRSCCLENALSSCPAIDDLGATHT